VFFMEFFKWIGSQTSRDVKTRIVIFLHNMSEFLQTTLAKIRVFFFMKSF
jgi:hypothetical protein